MFVKKYDGANDVAQIQCHGQKVPARLAESRRANLHDPKGKGDLRNLVHGATRGVPLVRFPITWNHVIEKESLKFKELEHVLIEKVEQFFRDMR